MTTAPVLITALLNAERESMIRGFTQADRLIPVLRLLATYETESTNFTHEASQVYQILNDDDRPGGMVHRSMSVGDVILFETPYGRTALRVEITGFSPVNAGLVAEHFTQQLEQR